MTLLAALRDFCSQHGLEKTYWVAYSGGLDSHVLLSLCHALRTECHIAFRVIHVNHGFSPYADAWALHCAQVCKNYAFDYQERRLHISLNAGDSIEEVARNARYTSFADCLGEGDVLLTAHQQDDQAETVLIQLLRGAGLKGLAAMPSIKPFARGLHGRPLLDFTREQLENYAREKALHWIEDESNEQVKFTRNFIRHDIFTPLKTRWPSVVQTISRSARHCAEAQHLLEEFAHEMCQSTQGSREGTQSVAKLSQLDVKKQKLVLRTWIQLHGYPLPDSKKLQTIQSDVLTASWDSLPCVRWQGVELRRFRDDLYLMTALFGHDDKQVKEWDLTLSPVLDLGQGKTLQALPVKGKGLRADINPLSIRFRQGGEKVHIPGRGHHTLKNLLQEWNVLPWQRNRIPLVFSADKLISVVGYFLDEKYMAKGEERGFELKM